MRYKLMVLLLCSSVAAFAQHGGGMGGSHMGGPPAGVGTGMGSMGADRSGGPGGHGGAMGTNSHQGAPSNLGKQSAGDILARNTKLASKLDSMLPNGEKSQTECAKFKNLGQCVAAIHVANNLGISFDQLRDKMISGESLGKAIHDISPNVNAKGEAKKGQNQANEDISESQS